MINNMHFYFFISNLYYILWNIYKYILWHVKDVFIPYVSSTERKRRAIMIYVFLFEKLITLKLKTSSLMPLIVFFFLNTIYIYFQISFSKNWEYFSFVITNKKILWSQSIGSRVKGMDVKQFTYIFIGLLTQCNVIHIVSKQFC